MKHCIMEFGRREKIWAASYGLSLAGLLGLGRLMELDFGFPALLAFTAAFGIGYIGNRRFSP
jgi:hypothetical protein